MLQQFDLAWNKFCRILTNTELSLDLLLMHSTKLTGMMAWLIFVTYTSLVACQLHIDRILSCILHNKQSKWYHSVCS